MFWRKKETIPLSEQKLSQAERAAAQYPQVIPNINQAMNQVRLYFDQHGYHPDYHPFNYNDPSGSIPTTLHDAIKYYAALQQATTNKDTKNIEILENAYYQAAQEYYQTVRQIYPNAKENMRYFYAALAAANLGAGGIITNEGEHLKNLVDSPTHFIQLTNELALFYQTHQLNTILTKLIDSQNLTSHNVFEIIPAEDHQTSLLPQTPSRTPPFHP